MLIKGMFGTEFSPTSTPFSLCTGQMRATQITHNSGWYNAAGEKLGWGDLGVRDFRSIQANLEDREVFIILGEQDSFWNFVTDFGTLGSLCETKPTVEAPGKEYVERHMTYVITRNDMFRISNYIENKLQDDIAHPALRVDVIKHIRKVSKGQV